MPKTKKQMPAGNTKPPVQQNKKASKTKGFTPEKRLEVMTFISSKRSADWNFEDIAADLAKQGIKTPRGKEWTANNLQMFYYGNEKTIQAYRGAPLGEVTKPAGGQAGMISKNLVLAIISEPGVPAQQKIDSLRMLLNT